ncbi:MAG: hypothetical protein ACRCTY_07590, partial [Candidatus Adiutrix sp.]
FIWLGIHSLLVGLAYWQIDGAFMPIMASFFLFYVGIKLALKMLRKYYFSSDSHRDNHYRLRD